jgi:hypothetical protein
MRVTFVGWAKSPAEDGELAPLPRAILPTCAECVGIAPAQAVRT